MKCYLTNTEHSSAESLDCTSSPELSTPPYGTTVQAGTYQPITAQYSENSTNQQPVLPINQVLLQLHLALSRRWILIVPEQPVDFIS